MKVMMLIDKQKLNDRVGSIGIKLSADNMVNEKILETMI